MEAIFHLVVDGEPRDLDVVIADRWWSRARGLWPGAPWPAFDVLQLPRCRAVHTFGMRVPIDIVFTDAAGRVISVRHALPPWRMAHDPRACCVWELRAGAAERAGLRSGVSLRAVRRERGATAVEFLLAAVLVVMPLAFAVLEISQLAVARHVLQHAVDESARQASVSGLSEASIRRSLGLGLLPLFVPFDPRATFERQDDDSAGETGRLDATRGLEGLARAYGESFRPDLSWVTLEALDGEGLAWRLRVRYCRELHFPLVRDFIPALLRWGATSPFDQACFARDRMPLEAWSLVLRRDEALRPPDGLPGFPPAAPDDVPVVPPPTDGGGGGGGGRDNDGDRDVADR